MSKIKLLKAREILDSRGNPTLEVVLKTEKETTKSSVPSGASKGKYEAVELRDGGKRYNGLGVLKAVDNVNKKIFPRLINRDVSDQKDIDQLLIEMDKNGNKAKIGANTVLSVSIAVCRAGALESKKSLYKYINYLYGKEKISMPVPCFNVINGGAHAGNDLDFQEFMIVPSKKKIKEAVREASEFYHLLKDKIRKDFSNLAVNVGDEGGFAPPLINPEEAVKLILGVKKIDLIIDVAAGEFFNKDGYKIGIKSLKKNELVDYYLGLIRKYPIIGLEDPFDEDDYDGWQLFNSKLKISALSTDRQNSKFLVIGDDLLATNPERIKTAGEKKYCNAMILKPNQIGTVTEALEAARLARKFKWEIMVSHRSGETNDDFVSDFAVGIGADYIKAGAPARGERVTKYNRLMEIEDDF